MQLREIHVIRFGVLENMHIEGLSAGLNVLYGPNEFGKSSLLELVRRVLFGFPDRRTNVNQYMLPHVDRNAGRLRCELADGTSIDVFRSTGKGKGPFTATLPDGSAMSEDGFLARLGHVSSELYRNVFSLDLAELFETNVAGVPEVRDRIYSAGFGGVSPTKLRAGFQKQADELFAARSGRMRQLAGAIATCMSGIEDKRQRLAQYDDKKNERERLGQREQELTARINEARSELRTREHQEHLYRTVLDMRSAREELAAMGETPEVGDEVLAELHERQSSLKELREQIEARRMELAEKRAALERITYNPALLERENDIRVLSQGLSRYRSAREELPELRGQAEAARAQLGRPLAAVGPDWTAERVRTFNPTAGQRDSLRQQESVLRERNEALDSARQKLDLHRDQVLVRASGRKAVPPPLRVAGAAVFVLGGAVATFSAVNVQTLPAILSGIVGVIGLLIAVVPGATRNRRDPVEEQLQAQVQQAEEALLAAETDWSECLVRVGLSPTYSTEAKDEALRAIEDAAREVRSIDELESRISHLRKVVADADDLYAGVARDTGQESQGSDVAAGIEALDARLAEARTAKVRQESLAEDIWAFEERIGLLEDQQVREDAALSDLLSTQGASSPAELEEKYRRHCTARGLEETIADRLHDIETRVGPGEACRALIEAVDTTPLEEIRRAIDELQGRIGSLQDEVAGTNRQVGALDSELDELESEQELVEREADVEVLRQQLRDAYREWLTARIALWGIESAVSRYEEERQPDVIRAAQEVFATMTDGRYERLIKPVDSDEIHMRDRWSNDRTVDQLSRGTREQLHLAMRLGLIEQYEQNSEPLPVVMDDVLVNFDDERGPLAIRALAEFAADRQVIVMTCHESALEMYRQAGANELTLRGS